MDGVIFGVSKAEQTLIVFSLVLLSLIIIPFFYLTLQSVGLHRLQQRPLWRDWRLWIPMLVYALLLGFRYDYSFDWDQYKNTFIYLQKGLLYRDDTEVGYLLINKILSLCGFNFYSIFILEGIVYIYCYYLLFKDHRRYLPFVLPIVFVSQYSNSLNISRQFFATSVLFIAYHFLLKNEKKKFWVISIVAGLIHSSAFLWMPVFFVFRKVNNWPLNLKAIAIACCILSFGLFLFKDVLYQQLESIFGLFSFKETYQDRVLSDKYTEDGLTFNMFVTRIVKMLLYIYLFALQDKAKNFESQSILRNFLVIGIIAMPMILLFSANELFLRLFFYISIFTDIGWGILVYNMIFKWKTVRYTIPIVCLTCICVFHYFWSFYAQIVNGFDNHLTNLFIIYK